MTEAAPQAKCVGFQKEGWVGSAPEPPCLECEMEGVTGFPLHQELDLGGSYLSSYTVADGHYCAHVASSIGQAIGQGESWCGKLLGPLYTQSWEGAGWRSPQSKTGPIPHSNQWGYLDLYLQMAGATPRSPMSGIQARVGG